MQKQNRTSNSREVQSRLQGEMCCDVINSPTCLALFSAFGSAQLSWYAFIVGLHTYLPN